MGWSRGRKWLACLLVGGFLLVLVPTNTSANHANVSADPFENSTWTEEKAGGSTFIARSVSGITEDGFRSPRHSLEVSFTSGEVDTDWGYVLRYRDFTYTDLSMLRIWYYAV